MLPVHALQKCEQWQNVDRSGYLGSFVVVSASALLFLVGPSNNSFMYYVEKLN